MSTKKFEKKSLSYFGADFNSIRCSIVKLGDEWKASVTSISHEIGISIINSCPMTAMSQALKGAQDFGIGDIDTQGLILCTHPYGVAGAKKNCKTKVVPYCNRL